MPQIKEPLLRTLIKKALKEATVTAGESNTKFNIKVLVSKSKNSKCIRNREVKGNTENIEKAELFIREYNAVNSTEFFISYEKDQIKIRRPEQKLEYLGK